MKCGDYMNYFECQSDSPFYKLFFYLDIKPFQSDKIFIDHKLKVKFIQELETEENIYSLIFVKIPTNKVAIFQECMEELNNKLLIFGYHDYNKVYDNLINSINHEMKVLRKTDNK